MNVFFNCFTVFQRTMNRSFTLENNWITRISLPINVSTVNYTISWLTHAGVLLFIGTFIGGLIQGAKVKDLFIVIQLFSKV